ncbi:hypothetical protein MBRA_04885 [Methylobacterium brachiatum]|jgi:hypothetical protein|uniref:Uncharacterized protein n=1 Tax=Methylobacterium brachiatum TaxID=269660 RepID=A0AAJ1WUH1_9HYPH|nr:hypothetical protein [Methylobacterium brachiatum]MCB4801032.1 hypothetical protein [Methylobacterium brachiatum]MDQ0541200.1 hypothetical protein [Methylobacterium brachiatum]CAA2159700.1 hypothetical protein MBRA_04885 [Methylobacterium brachiatum]
MPSSPSLSRILAAGTGLGGLGYMMAHPDPSVESILIGLACVILCAGLSAMPAPKKPIRREAAPIQPPPRQPEPQAIQLLPGPQPHRLLMAKVMQPGSEPPAAPSQQERSDDRQPQRTP